MQRTIWIRYLIWISVDLVKIMLLKLRRMGGRILGKIGLLHVPMSAIHNWLLVSIAESGCELRGRKSLDLSSIWTGNNNVRDASMVF